MLARRNRGQPSTLAAGLGVLVLMISVGWLALVWYHEGATGADPWASVLGFLLAAALARPGRGRMRPFAGSDRGAR